MLALVVECRLSTPLNYLCLETTVVPRILALSFISVLLRDIARPLQINENLQVFANQFVQCLVLQWIKLCCLINIVKFKTARIGQFPLDASLSVNDRRVVFGRLDQIENREQEIKDVAQVVPRVGQAPAEDLTVVAGVVIAREAFLFCLFVKVFHIEVNFVTKDLERDLTA